VKLDELWFAFCELEVKARSEKFLHIFVPNEHVCFALVQQCPSVSLCWEDDPLEILLWSHGQRTLKIECTTCWKKRQWGKGGWIVQKRFVRRDWPSRKRASVNVWMTAGIITVNIRLYELCSALIVQQVLEFRTARYRFLDILKGGPQTRDCKAHVCQDAVTRNGFMAKFLVLICAVSQMPF